jgi:hypothetical protein
VQLRGCERAQRLRQLARRAARALGLREFLLHEHVREFVAPSAGQAFAPVQGRLLGRWVKAVFALTGKRVRALPLEDAGLSFV